MNCGLSRGFKNIFTLLSFFSPNTSFEVNLYTIKCTDWDFPGGTVVKNPPANAGDMGSSPGLGRSHMLQSN